MSSGSFHLVHIDHRSRVEPRRPQRSYDPYPSSSFPGHARPLIRVKPESFVASYVDLRSKRQSHYRGGGTWAHRSYWY